MTLPLTICIPAWGADYVKLAIRYAIPSIMESLKLSPFKDITFLLYTDDTTQMIAATLHKQGITSICPPIPTIPAQQRKDPLARHHWVLLSHAHRDALARTPTGAICALWNADIVCSQECFSVIAEKLAGDIKVGASVGIRTRIPKPGLDDAIDAWHKNPEGKTLREYLGMNEAQYSSFLKHPSVPIGAEAKELNAYIWTNRHPITDQCTWDVGDCVQPHVMYFVEEAGPPTVSSAIVNPVVTMHCLHQTPMWVIPDGRNLLFRGTIDDDLLSRFADHEIWYAQGQFAMAELSPEWKRYPAGHPMTVPGIVDFCKRRTRWEHFRNFEKQVPIVGEPTRVHPAAQAIIDELRVEMRGRRIKLSA
jgi:hypothetical protein